MNTTLNVRKLLQDYLTKPPKYDHVCAQCYLLMTDEQWCKDGQCPRCASKSIGYYDDKTVVS